MRRLRRIVEPPCILTSSIFHIREGAAVIMTYLRHDELQYLEL